MKRILLSLTCLVALGAAAQQTEARWANVCSMPAEAKVAVRTLSLTGPLTVTGNSDIRQLRDLCWQLESLDMSAAQCDSLPPNAFHSRHRLRTLVLPAALRSIGSQALFSCDALTQLTIPASVERIGQAALSGCSALTQLTLASPSVQIADFAFAGCTALRTLMLAATVPPQVSADAFAGIDVSKVKLVVPPGAEKAYRKAPVWRNFYGKAKTLYAPVPERVALLPQPARADYADGKPLMWKSVGAVEVADGLDNERDHLLRIVRERTGIDLSSPRGGKAKVHLAITQEQADIDPEAYSLKVSAQGVSIEGGSAAGVFYALMTLEQMMLTEGGALCAGVPAIEVADKPRTHVRELMVDPCRIFIPFDELKAFVPEMARYKLNALHLHLVDDQAWRIEIKYYPRLTAEASSRVGMDDMLIPISGYYTQEQMRELVSYAARYHVTVVPEIEMPGHEVAAIHCYPELTCGAKQVPLRTTCGVSDELLCPGSAFTYEFLTTVFRELAEVFPSPYIHLGGDEAGNPSLDCWTHCEACNALKRELGITTIDRSENWRLQKHLFDKMIALLRDELGKTPMFWYESDFKDIQPGCVTFAWRVGQTEEALDAAIRSNARIMLCPGEHCYFDYPMAQGDMPEVNWGMPVTTLRDTYSLDPAWGKGSDFERNNLFGVAGTLWSECINTPERIYYQAYPRALALAEVGWSPQEVRSYDDFLTRLVPVVRDMQRRGLTVSLRW